MPGRITATISVSAPVEDEQIAEQEHDRERIAHQRDDHAGEHLQDLVDLEDDRVDDGARRLALKKSGARVDHAVEHLEPQLQQDLVRHIRQQIARRVLRDAAHEREPDHRDRHDPVGLVAALRAEAVVEQRLEQHRNAGLARGDERPSR